MFANASGESVRRGIRRDVTCVFFGKALRALHRSSFGHFDPSANRGRRRPAIPQPDGNSGPLGKWAPSTLRAGLAREGIRLGLF